MNPEDRTPPTPDPTPGRDEELARALAVGPLDDLTRRRLVRTALAATESTAPTAAPTARQGRTLAALGIAASLVVGVVVGAAIVTRPEAPSVPTAAGSEQAEASRAADAAPAAPEAASRVPPQPLGDLGAPGDLAAIARAVDVRLQAGGSEADDEAFGSPPCADAPVAELVVVSASGTATFDGRLVVVQVGPAPSGENVVVVLDAVACTVVGSTPLPST